MKYLLSGSGKHTIIFLHGWSCDPDFFLAQIKFFKKKYRVLTPDWSSFENSHGSDFILLQAAKAIALILEKNNISNPILVGHSMGGFIALLSTYYKLINAQRIIFLDTSIPLSKKKKKVYMEFADRLKTDEHDQAIMEMVKNFTIDSDNERTIDFILKKMLGAPINNSYVFLKEVDRIDASRYIRSCACPMLYIASSLTKTNDASLKKINNKIEYAKVVSSGHFMALTAAEQINAMIHHYLRLII